MAMCVSRLRGRLCHLDNPAQQGYVQAASHGAGARAQRKRSARWPPPSTGGATASSSKLTSAKVASPFRSDPARPPPVGGELAFRPNYFSSFDVLEGGGRSLEEDTLTHALACDQRPNMDDHHRAWNLITATRNGACKCIPNRLSLNDASKIRHGRRAQAGGPKTKRQHRSKSQQKRSRHESHLSFYRQITCHSAEKTPQKWQLQTTLKAKIL